MPPEPRLPRPPQRPPIGGTLTGETATAGLRLRAGGLRIRAGVAAVALTAATALTMSMTTVGPAHAAQQPVPAARTASTVLAARVAGPATGGSPRKHRRPAPVAQLPPDWPRHLPVPAGQVMGSTGSLSQWSVQILVRGSAAAVHRRAMAFYVARGFSRVTDSVLRRGRLRIVVVTENRDHSAAKTFLVLGVTRR
jgi:hypothetical protein